jgi:hypothetical protein
LPFTYPNASTGESVKTFQKTFSSAAGTCVSVGEGGHAQRPRSFNTNSQMTLRGEKHYEEHQKPPVFAASGKIDPGNNDPGNNRLPGGVQ